ncbi:thermonuclease family protein [Sphingobium agri]|uniref:Thermonuclease family protein n=1 Tax=Sphingobium agri TaxID=2933566 RepID=A0ABT0DSZ0_9SPHN|nr:thermonuclease family protein [Sphingobium agri]MCK0530238.1 thermonuclease family protein [Sphingobium agri]
MSYQPRRPGRHGHLRLVHASARPWRSAQASRTRFKGFLAPFLIIASGLWAGGDLLPSLPGTRFSPSPNFIQQEGLQAASFAMCDDGYRSDCVIDGDTFRLGGETIRIADIDTPETHPARCPEEASLGAQATERLRELLNAGSFMLQPIDRDQDRYGRSLRIVMRGDQSIGAMLVAEGLARPWMGSRQPWCRS